MNRKVKYVTDEEIYNLEVAIYNDDRKALREIITQAYQDEFNEELIKELTKGKEYKRLEQDDRYILTSDGEVYNAIKLRRIKPLLSRETFFVYLNGDDKVDFKEEFLKEGWEWDYHKIINYYKKKNYKFQITQYYRNYFNSLL